MNSDVVFRITLLIVLTAFVLHRAYYTRKYARPESEVSRERESSRSQKLIGFINLLALLVTVVYLIWPDRLDGFRLPFPDWLRWFGVLVAASGFALLQWSQSTLSRNWSDTPRLLGDQELVTKGPYRRMRHPIYTAFMLILSAPLFLSANWLVGLLWIVPTFFEVTARARYEESILVERYGEAYLNYMNTTGRLLPRF